MQLNTSTYQGTVKNYWIFFKFIKMEYVLECAEVLYPGIVVYPLYKQ